MTLVFILLFLQSIFVYRETLGIEISEISSAIQPCKYNDPNLNECVKDVGHKLIPMVAKGIPLMNIPSVDPLMTPEKTFVQKTGGNNLAITYKNIVQTGFSAIDIENADLDLEHGVMTFKLKYPYITFTADYSASGQFLGFEVSGSGKANVSVWNAYSSFVLKFHVVKDHIKGDSVIMGFSFDKIFLDYTNLMINNDKELSESASQFINDNSKEIIEGFKQELEEFYSDISKNLVQILFDLVPYSRLFPKD